jgi:hypothetical protein
MDTIHTLTQLLTQSDCNYQIYDLSRRVQLIDNATFERVENASQPYPFPIQRQAQFAVAYWNESNQPWIWFLKFNLDERGLLNQADVGQFLKFVIEAMGTRLNQAMTDEQQKKLSNNPFTFKPKEDKMALFHSVIRFEMNLPTSQYYQHAREYFLGNLGWDQWKTVGLQGITDICARLSVDDNNRMIRSSLNKVAREPLYALLGALEHISLNEKLALSLRELALLECKSDDPDLFFLSAITRALSGAPANELESVVSEILASPRLSHQEVLIGIAGRAWAPLANPTIAEKFLLRLAQTGNQALFNQIFADLVMLPSLRLVLLPLLHSNPSQELASALMALQQATTNTVKH